MTLLVTATKGKEQKTCTSGSFHAYTIEIGDQMLTIGSDSIYFEPPLRRSPLVGGVESKYSDGRLYFEGDGEFSFRENDLVVFGIHKRVPFKEPDHS